jgi:hypothetical protein
MLQRRLQTLLQLQMRSACSVLIQHHRFTTLATLFTLCHLFIGESANFL